MDRTDPRTPPHTTRTPGIRLTGTEQHEHDALAELFLGDAPLAPSPMNRALRDEAPVPVRTSPPKARFEGSAVRRTEEVVSDDTGERPAVELVILGHLPVRASLWVRQYACLAARKRSETVALIRTSGSSVAVDVITGHQSAEIEPTDSIEDGVTIARHAAARLILRVDETVEPEVLERAGVDEVTILTGADEAAVVASYRLIKSLVSTLEDRVDPESGPRVRVAVMGNPGEDIAQARQKIERACRAFLGRPIEVLDASGRIDATGTTTVCRAEGEDATARVLDAVLGGAEIAPAPIAPNAALRLTDDDLPEMPEIVVRPIARTPVAEPESIAPAPVVPPAAQPAPAESPAVESPLARVFRREPLAELVEGLSSIEARCPSAGTVEFACDDGGHLHALTTDDAGAGEGVSRLLVASAWARANLPLLIRAETRVSIPADDPRADSGVVLHLLCREPSLARAVLDTEVLVYALASVNVRGEELAVATPLNG